MQRRDFLKKGALAGLFLAGAGSDGNLAEGKEMSGLGDSVIAGPVLVSTWRHGVAANQAGLDVLRYGGSVIDAVEKGVRVTEADPEVTSVGLGGFPNRDGQVEVDAAIMEGLHLEAGSVASVQDILHPVSVARKVMEKTRHVMLVGAGATQFALENGFDRVPLLTPKARAAWQKWVKGQPVRSQESTRAEDHHLGTPPRDTDDHDTIGLIAIDGKGNVAVACTTSGMAWKIPGRVGDSPLVGPGLYCDNKVGGAVATGVGEEVIKVCGAYQVVEFMRQGMDPDKAVTAVLERVLQRDPGNRKQMVGFVALRKDGVVGHGSTTPGFQAAVTIDGRHQLVDSPSLVPPEQSRTAEGKPRKE